MNASVWHSSHQANRGATGYIESFNGRLRDECLNITLFWSFTHARVVITDWKNPWFSSWGPVTSQQDRHEGTKKAR